MKKRSLKFWKSSTLAGLFIGYSGYYICRSNLAIAAPLIIKEFGNQGINKEVIGQIASIGVVFYAIGKVFNGILGDIIGGKKVFILGMLGSVATTIIFGMSTGVGVFMAVWALNRLIQSMGWGGLVKITANWVSFKSYGMVMGFLSLSFLLGDIIARLFLGQLLNWNVTWREIFFVSAGTLLILSVIDIFAVRNNPEALGFAPSEVNPENLFKNTSENESPKNLIGLLIPYFKSIPFLLILTMSFGLTAIREAFNFWIPTYLNEIVKIPAGMASQASALYPVFGMISIFTAGYISDRFLKSKRGIFILMVCMPIAFILYLMTKSFTNPFIYLLLISLIGLLLLGPYSFLSGAMSMDLGGKKGAATAVGLVDAIGYLGGTLSVWLMGMLSEHFGWNAAFIVLAAIAGFTTIASFFYYWYNER